MEDNRSVSEQQKVGKSLKSKLIKKLGNRPPKMEVDKDYEDTKRKYANAIAYLLIKGVKQSELRDYFNASEENLKRYNSIKKFRQSIIDSRPKAKQWVDKPFYIGLKLGSLEASQDQPCVTLMLGECAFKQTTSAVSSKWELEGYIDTIAKIIESEKIWADPDMADFDTGEREDISTRYIKKKPATQAKQTDSDLIKLESE